MSARRSLGILGEAVLFSAAIACGGSAEENGEVGASCTAPSDDHFLTRKKCNTNDQVVECLDGRWKAFTSDPASETCTCPEGDELRQASCSIAGFVGITRSRRLVA
jgi:hypothetical protein